MAKRSNTRMLYLLGGVALALLLLAAGLSGLDFRPGRWIAFWTNTPVIDLGTPLDLPGAQIAWQVFVWLLLLVVVPVVVIALIRSRELRRAALKRILWWVAITLGIYLLLRSANLQALRSASTAGGAPAGSPSTPPLPPAGGRAALAVDPPQWLVVVISVLLIALILLAIWFCWRRAHRPEPEGEPVELLAGEAREALEQLRGGGDVRDTVLRCYGEMSRVLSERQAIRREQAMTPREFEQRLTAAGLRSEHIRRLTRLFERIRYGGRAPSKGEEDEAVACLTAIVEAYGKA